MISPDGLFYSCEYGKHDDTLLLLGWDVWEAEEHGWIRVYTTVATGRARAHRWHRAPEMNGKQLETFVVWAVSMGANPHELYSSWSKG